MIEAEIDPRDLLEFNLDMDALKAAELLKGELGPFAKSVGVFAGKYAPPVPESTYVRTGHLDRNWYYKLLDRLSVEVGNLAFYAGYVHGDIEGYDLQVPWHGEHGWRRLKEEGEKSLKAFMRKLEEKIERIWK